MDWKITNNFVVPDISDLYATIPPLTKITIRRFVFTEGIPTGITEDIQPPDLDRYHLGGVQSKKSPVAIEQYPTSIPEHGTQNEYLFLELSQFILIMFVH